MSEILAYDNILKKMVESGTKMTQPTAKFFLDALYEYAAEKIAEEQVRINVGTVSIYPMIDGSFDSEDVGTFAGDETGQTIEGENLVGATVKAKFERDGSEEELDLEPSEYTAEDGKVVIAGGGGAQWAGVAAQASLAGWIKLAVTASVKSDEIRLTLKA